MKLVRLGPFMLLCGATMLASPAFADATKEACVTSATTGQRQRDEGKLLTAHESFMACAREECPTIVREDCSKWAEQVHAQLPSVVLGARDTEGRDRTNVTVTIDGAPFATSLDGLPKPLDPGPHRVHLTSEGLVGDVEFALRAYEPPRVLVVVLREPAATSTRPAPPPAEVAAPGRPVWPVFALGGVSLGAAITAASLVVVAHGQNDDLEDRCAPRCTSSDTASLDRSLLVANIAAGVSILALAGALYVGFVRLGAPAIKTGPSVSIGPLTLDRGGGASTVIRY